MAPKDENELRQMLRSALEYPGPAALRFPRGAALGVPIDPDIKPLKIGEAELLRDGRDIGLVAIGAEVPRALAAAERLAEAGIDAAVLNARFVKPLDEHWLREMAERCGALLVVEEHSAIGGFGEAVLAFWARSGVTRPMRALGVGDHVVEHGSPNEVLADLGLDAAGIARAARELLGR